MDWHTKIDSKVEKYGQKWAKIAAELSAEFGERIDSEKVRSYYRYQHRDDEEKQIKEPIKAIDLLKLLDKPHTLAELAEKTGLSQRIVLAKIDDYRDEGYQINNLDDRYQLCKVIVPKENLHTADWSGNSIIRFGVVSDTHLGSKWQQLTHLNTLYDLFEREKIDTVFHPGDITDGCNMRRGMEYEVFAHGVDEQAQYVVDKYPFRKGIVTKFITGNHDHSGVKAAGVDIGRIISSKRADMEYLGMNNAKVMITPKCSVELNHGLDGASYALSYSPQKYLDSLSGGTKANILLSGHRHKALYMFYRNVHEFEAGTLCAQTPWMRGKRIAAHVGGWIIEVHVDNQGTITRCKGEFIPFYKMLENDY